MNILDQVQKLEIKDRMFTSLHWKLYNNLVINFSLWTKNDTSKPYCITQSMVYSQSSISWLRDLFSFSVLYIYKHLTITDAFQNVCKWFFSTSPKYGRFINVVGWSHKYGKHMDHSLVFLTGRKNLHCVCLKLSFKLLVFNGRRIKNASY